MLAKGHPRRNSNLLKGLAVLETMAAEAREFSLAEVADLTGLDKSHACRLLRSLVDAGYIVRSPRNRRYRIGLRTLELSSSILARMDLYTLGQPYLREVSDNLRASSYLGVPHRGKVLVVATAYPAGVYVDEAPGFGSVMDLDDSAMGKVLLAHMEPEARDELVPEDDDFRGELETVSRSGLAMVHKQQDDAPSVVGVAAPVRDHQGQVIAALGASVLQTEWDGRDQETFKHTVRKGASGLSFALGYAAGRYEVVAAHP